MAVLVFVNLINYVDCLTLAGVLEQVKQEFDANDASGKGFCRQHSSSPTCLFALQSLATWAIGTPENT